MNVHDIIYHKYISIELGVGGEMRGRDWSFFASGMWQKGIHIYDAASGSAE